MLTVVSIPAGLCVIDVIPKGLKFCSAHCLFHIMDPLWAALQSEEQHPFQKLVIHADDARNPASEIMDECFGNHRLQWADYPPSSPDLALSDFLPFGFIRGQLKGTHSSDEKC
jgi:hypothetical protein